MKTILAFDTTDTLCSVAILHENKIFEIQESTPQKHSQKLISLLDKMLLKSGIVPDDIDAIAFGKGPGSFTGIRIAASVAHGLSLAWGCVLIPVSSLEALAQQAVRLYQATKIISAIDARMNEVYWASFGYDLHSDRIQLLTEEQLASPLVLDDYALSQAEFCMGTGWQYQAALNRLPAQCDAQAKPLAQDIIRIASRISWDQLKHLDQALPSYLRDTVAKPKKRSMQNPLNDFK